MRAMKPSEVYERAVLTQSCTIIRQVPPQPTPYGGLTNDTQPARVSAPCRVQQAGTQQEGEAGQGRTSLGDWEILLPVGTRVRFGDTIETEGERYEVIGTDAGKGNALKLKAYCQRKEGGI